MAQITDIGGQDYGNKIKMEGDAKQAGISLGIEPETTPVPPAPQRSLPTRKTSKPLNIGRGSDFIMNGPPKGNNPLAGLGQSAKVLSDDGQAYKNAISKAKDLMENSTIPLVKQQAAEYIKNAAYLRSIQRYELE